MDTKFFRDTQVHLEARFVKLLHDQQALIDKYDLLVTELLSLLNNKEGNEDSQIGEYSDRRYTK